VGVVLAVIGGLVLVVALWTAVLVGHEQRARRAARFRTIAGRVAEIRTRPAPESAAESRQAAPQPAARRHVEWVPPVPPERVGAHSTSTGRHAKVAS
jgi:hypothetical protein